MRVYRMAYRDVMGLPMKVFWHLDAAIPRLLADEQKQLVEAFSRSQNPDAAVQMLEELDARTPAPVKLTGQALMQISAKPDPGAADTLRALAG